MIRLLLDEHIEKSILTGVLRRMPDADILNVQTANLQGMSDPSLLEWALLENRILVSRDAATMIDFAYQRLIAGQPMAGLFAVSSTMSIGRVIEELIVILNCSTASDWKDKVTHLPL